MEDFAQVSVTFASATIVVEEVGIGFKSGTVYCMT